MRSALPGLIAASCLAAASGNIVKDVRALLAQNKLAEAGKLVAGYRARAGLTPEGAEAVSWLGRHTLASRDLDAAGKYAAAARQQALELLRGRTLDAEPHLPLALGASIEVHAQVLAARGQRSEAVDFLNHELATYRATSIEDRIRKNINLLSLEGKPAPKVGAGPWRGHPTLLFLWAHWCGDCKTMAPSLASLREAYKRRGLVIVAPTRLYGYVAGGEEAAPAAETSYIQQVWSQHYAPLAGVPMPTGAAYFHEYGVSTTPTLVLVDARGIVRMYHPGALTRDELARRIEPLLRR
jgi:thiol-disulfide isomerase/thioredoxin